jgi:hypothetical protein
MSLLDGLGRTHRIDDSSEAADRVIAELAGSVASAHTLSAWVISERSLDIKADLETSAVDELLVDSKVDNLTDDLFGLP